MSRYQLYTEPSLMLVSQERPKVEALGIINSITPIYFIPIYLNEV